LALKKENIWFMVLSGSFKLVLVQPDSSTQSSESIPCDEYLLEKKIMKLFMYLLHLPMVSKHWNLILN
jgi:hypothetical protein